ncbi:MAG: phosphoglycerate kinase [Gemmataceae bacterium]
MAKKTLADLPANLKGSKVLVRVDFNVPHTSKGEISNDRRIRGALSTIQKLLDGGAAVIAMSHFGRPKGDPQQDLPFTMDKIAKRLGELLGKPVQKANDSSGDHATKLATNLKSGEVLLLENLRFHKGKQGSCPLYAGKIAALGDIYVNDAFGTCHRKDASMVALPEAMQGKPRVVGTLVAKELEILNTLLSRPGRPDDADEGAAGNLQADVVQNRRPVIGGRDTYQVDGQITGLVGHLEVGHRVSLAPAIGPTQNFADGSIHYKRSGFFSESFGLDTH